MANPEPLARDAYRRSTAPDSNTRPLQPYDKFTSKPCICGRHGRVRLPTDEWVCAECAATFYRELVHNVLERARERSDDFHAIAVEFNTAMILMDFADLEIEQHVRRG